MATAYDQLEVRSSKWLLAIQGVLFVLVLWALNAITNTATGHLPPHAHDPWIAPLLAVVATLVGIGLVRSATSVAADASARYLGVARASTLRTILTFLLYVLLAIVVASQVHLDLSGLALSGAVTGVILGIAAQTSLSNVIAGIVILFTRPVRPGEYVTVRAAAFAGIDYSGEVGDVTLFYTTIFAGPQEIRVPNSTLINSVVVLRPQALDVYVPLILPPARWESLSTDELARTIAAVLPPGRRVTAVVERMDGNTVQIGLRASVADEHERSLLEKALLHAMSPHYRDGATGPHPDSE